MACVFAPFMNPHSLPLLQNLDEVARLHEGRMRSSIEPRKSPAKHLDIEVSALHVSAIDVGDLNRGNVVDIASASLVST